MFCKSIQGGSEKTNARGHHQNLLLLWFTGNAMSKTWVSEQKLSGAKARAKEGKGKDERTSSRWAWPSIMEDQRRDITPMSVSWPTQARKNLIFLLSIYCPESFQRKISSRQLVN